MVNMKTRVFLLAFALLTPIVAAQVAPPAAKSADVAMEDLGAILEPIRAKNDLPGLAAVVLRGRTVIAGGVAGTRKRGDATPVTLDDRWHLGSCTKSMTATLCAILVQDGTLRWNSTLGEVFPDLAPQMNETWRGVTLELLCTNSSGAPGGLDRDGLWSKLWKRDGTPTEQRVQLLAGVTKHPPEAPPGTKFIYSNAGFAMAGAMAERATGKAWEDLLRERLFTPLGMTSAGFGAPGTWAENPPIDQPWGHTAVGTFVQPGTAADNPPAIGPAGTVHMSLPDWAGYIALHVEGEDATRARLLPAAAYTKLHDPHLDGYAFGWGVTKRGWAGGDQRVLTHNGSNTMWFCVAWLAPNKDMAILVATNQGGKSAGPGADAVAGALVKRFLADAPVRPAGP